MSLLLYCIAPASAEEASVNGVGETAVRSVESSGFRFFYSEIMASELASRDISAAAQQVHRVVSDIFSRGPVLPFRYPTVMTEKSEIEELALTRRERFGEYFQRVGEKVQMDVRITLTLEESPAGNDDRTPSTDQRSDSGRAYLEGRARCQVELSAASEKCRQMAPSGEWRMQRGDKNIRCQALISRVEVVSFFERMRALELPEGVKAAVSGPWPPAGFWEDESR